MKKAVLLSLLFFLGIANSASAGPTINGGVHAVAPDKVYVALGVRPEKVASCLINGQEVNVWAKIKFLPGGKTRITSFCISRRADFYRDTVARSKATVRVVLAGSGTVQKSVPVIKG